MDTSPEYVEMCQKAEELHRLEVLGAHGNFIICPIHQILFEASDGGGFYAPCKCQQGIWLPRQDQLQEMVKGRYAIDRLVELLLWATTSWDGGLNWRPAIGGWSMEQLWLGVVMKEKFEKLWDGSEWRVEARA